MWPKMLLELLPHLSRLVPMWDKFLNNKAASEKALQDSMQSLNDSVRNDLGQVTAAHAALYRELQDQSAQIAQLQEEVARARSASERAESAALMPDPHSLENARWARRIVSSIIGLAVLVVISIILELVLHRAA